MMAAAAASYCKMSSSGRSKEAASAAALVILLVLLAAAGGVVGADKCDGNGWPASIDKLLPCNPVSFPAPKPPPTGDGLSDGFYNKPGMRSCPNAEQLVKKAVEDASSKNRTIGAGLIRLHFHDAFVRGCDASVLLTKTKTGNTDTERTGGPNINSLRGFEVIDAAKKAIEAECSGKVSCADILAFAARDASFILSNGKISYAVPAGRLDGLESFASETIQLPGPDSDVKQLEASFVAQGLNLTDMVTLSAAHSIGDARCRFFTGRLSDMDPAYANYLRATCNAGGPDTRVNQDNRTANVLDNQYYKNIPDKFVLFKSDDALSSSDTSAQVTDNAANSLKWEKDFGNAMVKMGKIISPGAGAEIRKVCSQIN